MNDKRSYTEYTVTTATTDFVIGFDDYDDITKDTIVVTVNGVLAESQGYAVMRKNAQVVTITPAVQSGTVRLTRVTDIDESFHQFTAGALFSAKSVDENFQQVRHSQQEVRDGFVFLEYNTNGIVQASKEATAQAKAATVEATASAVRAETAADTAVQAVGSLQGVVDAATTATTNADKATATATTAASQATTATTSAQNAAQAATVAKQEAATATAAATAAAVDTLAATGRAIAAAELAENTDVSQLQQDLDIQKYDTGVVSTALPSGGVVRTVFDTGRDVVSSARFGIVANSPLDQTAKMDAFLNYLRTNNCKGIMPVKGTVKLTANKQRTFGVVGEVNYQVVNYAVDISGIELEGIYSGYENVNGTILDIQGTGVGFFQAKETLASCTYAISGFQVVNATCALQMTYALFCNIKNFVYKACTNAIILGENTFTAGAIGNIFTNVYGKCTGAPLQMIGTKWNNANQFHGCYFTGDAPSVIDVSGGYGAISNTFWGGEFTTIANSTAAALVIGNSRSTNFVGVFFEPKSHAIIIDGQAKKLMINSCTLGSTRNNNTLSPEPCMIWHKSGSASLTVISGSVFLGDATGLQDNMRLVYSSDPTNFDCNIVDNPFVFLTGTTGWKYVTLDNLSQFRSFSGQITESTPVTFSSAGGSISNLTSDSKVTYQITGNSVNVVIYVGLQASSVLGAGDYYISLKLKPKVRSVGNFMYNKAGSATIYGGSNISAGNTNLFPRVPTVQSVYDDDTKVVTTTLGSSYTSEVSLAGYNTAGSSIYGQISYTF